MHPDLQRYFNHVWPLFWPWLVWNLVRVARWHTRTGRDALMAVDCFGNIRLVFVADAPPLDDLYTYEAPRLAAWEHPACRSDVPACVHGKSGMIMLRHDVVHHDPAKSGLVIYRHGVVRYDHGLHVRGPPWPGCQHAPPSFDFACLMAFSSDLVRLGPPPGMIPPGGGEGRTVTSQARWRRS